MTQERLDGRRIVVPETRELDLFCAMLERLGAQTLRCPLVGIHDLVDQSPVERWVREFIRKPYDDVIFYTGEGLRRLSGWARRNELADEFVGALGQVRTITRGPKPAKALRELGLAPTLAAVAPTTAGLLDTIRPLDLKGRRVGLQLFPEASVDPLLALLDAKLATVIAITPYRYAPAAESASVADMIRAMAAGEIDLIAFTSTPQVGRMVTVADAHGLRDALTTGLARTRIAAVGPVVAQALIALAGRVDIEPSESFHLKPLVTAIQTAFAAPEGVRA